MEDFPLEYNGYHSKAQYSLSVQLIPSQLHIKWCNLLQDLFLPDRIGVFFIQMCNQNPVQ
jgi:hypothetical protein